MFKKGLVFISFITKIKLSMPRSAAQHAGYQRALVVMSVFSRFKICMSVILPLLPCLSLIDALDGR
jgi:hypothetical protein